MMTFIGWILMFITEGAQLLVSFILCCLMWIVAEDKIKEIEENRKNKGE